jgi:transcriptional regulator with XRE-family HTH domain
MATDPTDTIARDQRALGRGLRRLREQAGLTQDELAARAGTSDTYISLLENGHRGVRWSTVTRLLRTLGVDLRQLVDAIDEGEERDLPRGGR